MSAVLEEKKRVVMITEQRMHMAEYERQDWVANVELGHTVEDLKDPAYWAHMAPKLKPYDHIEARSDDGSWVAYFIVLQVQHVWARVVLDRVVTLARESKDLPAAMAARFEVKHKGPHHKWCVIRLSDSQILKSECIDKREAEDWLREYEQRTR